MWIKQREYTIPRGEILASIARFVKMECDKLGALAHILLDPAR
jgi:hypothetical protein